MREHETQYSEEKHFGTPPNQYGNHPSPFENKWWRFLLFQLVINPHWLLKGMAILHWEELMKNLQGTELV